MSEPSLFVVATPIGNLEDITARAIRTLQSVDLVLCEDTRNTGNLLAHFGISVPLRSYHQHTSARQLNEIINELRRGRSAALVTDAGTPGISDPGNELVARLVSMAPDVRVVPVPGPSALIAALSIGGFPTGQFVFLGFPPHKNKRQKFFKDLAIELRTIALYESGHRIKKCLGELHAVLAPNRPVVIGRELTKKFETVYRVKAGQLSSLNIDERGEFVVVIGPH